MTPSPQSGDQKKFCGSKVYKFGKGMDLAGEAIGIPGIALAIVGEVAVPTGGGVPGAAIAEIGGVFGTVGQASKDYAAGRPMGEIALRALGNLMLGKVLTYGARGVTRLPGGSKAVDAISGMIGEKYVKGLSDFLDPKWCGDD